jgi:MoxR-like ATPase
MTTAAQKLLHSLEDALARTVFGMDETIRGLCIALINRGHVLLEGVPGLGKTLLAKTLATHMGGDFKRIQCTADLMPSDLTGIHVYHPEKKEFVFVSGPLFADIVLVDEINRTGPKTQSALLQAMEEGVVTIDRNTYRLPENFFVIASQNPHEFEGTYPLPESQLDRFLLRLEMTYPESSMEEKVLRTYNNPGGGHEFDPAAIPKLDVAMLEQARQAVEAVYVSDAIYRYVQQISRKTRQHPQIMLGLSIRGALALMRCARAHAAIDGQEFVTPDNVKAVARAVMEHRLVLSPDTMLEGIGALDVMEAVINDVEVPRDLAPRD